jgi:hypothetical protein
MDILGQKQTTYLDTQIGKIKVQIPSLPKKLDIERRKGFYTGGLSFISSYGADIADMFATLDVVMIESTIPKTKNGDWDYDQVYNEDALNDAYKKAVVWLDSFRKPVESEQA